MAPNAYLPADDPGKNGGATYMGTSQQPAQEDWENIFGPAGREVVKDPQRNKRHQRWHLPDRLKGPNNFLTDRIDGLITDATSSPFTSVILPYLYVENPDQPLTWNTFSYDEGLASRVPYEAAARVLTQTKSSHSAYIVRQGLAISMEHNFMMSPAGRADFQNQLLQLVGSIQYTNDLDCHIALITAPNYERTEVEKYAYNERDVYQTIKLYTEMYGIAQKNANGLDCVIEEAKQVFRKWGAKEPTFLLTNSRLGFQQNMTLERTQYLTNGIDGVRRLRDGPELSKYRGLTVINTRSFSLEAGRAPRDLLVRRVRVAEHYALPPMRAGELKNGCVKLYDEGKDQMVPISGETLFKKSCLKGTDYGGAGQPADCDAAWKTALNLDRYFGNIDSHLWTEDFWTCAEVTKYFATEKDYKDWMTLNAAPADNNLRGWYHPLFVATLRLFDSTTTYDAAAATVRATFADAMNDEMFQTWLRYMITYKSTKGGSKDFGQIMLCGLNKTGDAATNSFQIDGINITGYGDITHHEGHEYRFTLPFHACWTHSVPPREDIYEKLFNRDDASSPIKYNLFLLRPTIEHSMIGCVVGRGGAEDLGATLWGQTELSCYDDAMHGKWGMNYKYHARSLVYNEKHLLRLWDVAFAGYHGGMGTTIVDDENIDGWSSSCVHLDEALSYSHPDLFVMRFNDAYTKEHLPNPVCFHHDYDAARHQASGYAIDPANIYNVFKDEMMLAENLTRNDVARFLAYKALMPDFDSLHKGRKTAGHASHEGDTHQNSFSFQGTMEVWSKGACTLITRGTGHLGHSCCGSSSIRSGKGMMNPMSIDTSVRVV
jgi:hypothetical protein